MMELFKSKSGIGVGNKQRLFSRLSARHGEGHVPDRPGCHLNRGGGGHVLHHFLWLYRSSQREHSPPQDSNRPHRHITNTGTVFCFHLIQSQVSHLMCNN